MQKIWINGSLNQNISVLDRGLSYGDGLFETIRIDKGQPQLLEAHLERLSKGLERLQFPPNSMQRLETYLAQMAFEGDQTLKITLTRGLGERGYRVPDHADVTVIFMLSSRDESLFQIENGVAIRLCDYQLPLNPFLAGIKHLNRLDQIMARNEWQGDLYADGILCDTDGFLAEGTMSNLFWVDASGEVFTPSLDKCGVRGVMRDHLIQLLRREGMSVTEGRYLPEVLFQANEIFICNSLIEVWPVSCVEEQAFSIGPVSQKLQQLLAEEKCP